MSTRPSAHPTGPSDTPNEGGDRWWALSADDALDRLDSSANGLTTADAAERLKRYGPNQIRVEDVEPWWSLAGRQFRDPLIYILLVAAVVTLGLRHYIDAGVILAVVVLNAVIGFVQEYRARQAMLALAHLGAPKADVIRDGETRHLSADELVPGDVALLTSGARVPADLRLVRALDLEIDESMLTGESVPVRKQPEAVLHGAPVAGDQVNMAFGATMVTRGRARGVVVRTGPATEVGRIAEAVHEVGRVQTPLQRKVHDFGGKVGIAIMAMAVLAGVLGFLRGLGWAELFVTAVALAVASIPEGLPVVLTVTLAVGVRRMAGRKAIIRRLPAVETLGSTTVIASDKTGTLTRNEMTVRAVWTVDGRYTVSGVGYARDGSVYLRDQAVKMTAEAARSSGARQLATAEHASLRETLLAGVLASEADARMVDEEGNPLGDPTEVALLVAASKAGEDPADVRLRYPEMGILPFEPALQFMATLVAVDGASRIYLKGAPEAVLARVDRVVGPEGVGSLDPDIRDRIREGAHGLAGEGLRVLAMAYKDTSADRLDLEATADGFAFCGLQAMEDPVRPEVIDAVAAVQGAGIRVLMLTGDHLATARAIGAQLGFDDTHRRAIEGSELATMTDEALDACLEAGVQVFARVAPEHKLRIVQRLRAKGEVVAVTGDGVNDAPALRAAHIGIAMGITGTDVAREASDMVLQDDNFATIRAAVEEGRVVFSNVRKVTFFLLSTGVGQVITILVALAAGWPLPFLAAQILWINLVTNGLQDIALAVEPGEPGLLARKPRVVKEGILPPRLLRRLGGVGAVLAAGTLLTFWWALEASGDIDTARTVAMTQMVVFQFFHVFNCRSLDRSIFGVPFFSNRFLFASLVAALLAQLAVVYWGPLQNVFRTVPLDPAQWAVIVTVASTVILGGELDKAWQRKRGTGLG